MDGRKGESGSGWLLREPGRAGPCSSGERRSPRLGGGKRRVCPHPWRSAESLPHAGLTQGRGPPPSGCGWVLSGSGARGGLSWLHAPVWAAAGCSAEPDFQGHRQRGAVRRPEGREMGYLPNTLSLHCRPPSIQLHPMSERGDPSHPPRRRERGTSLGFKVRGVAPRRGGFLKACVARSGTPDPGVRLEGPRPQPGCDNGPGIQSTTAL